MKVFKKAVVTASAAFLLPLAIAAAAPATNITECNNRTDLVVVEHQGGVTCFANPGTIAYELHGVRRLSMGNNRVQVAWESNGTYHTQTFDKWVVVTSQTHGDGTPIGPAFQRIYQLWRMP
ncbi:beta/gamma crystallin domain-containing protein [Nonomuraea sp. NPDC049714]|uniref:beta/gamma crystallin domain-containing protein n=1 Tax=Nonomuraea sp. NPDC049714 TaxID=3364357 RepID=UPI00379855CC